MDTILYFYKKKGLERPLTEPVGLKSYLLIRIGLDVEEGRWFGRKLEENLSGEDASAADGVKAGGNAPAAGGQHADDAAPREQGYGLRAGLRHPWRVLGRKWKECKTRRREQARRRAWEQEEAAKLAAREEAAGRVEEAMAGLAREVAELAGAMDGCSCVYEDSLRKALISGQGEAGGEAQILPVLWRKNFPVEEFHGYAQRFWVEQMLSRVERLEMPPHFIVLGTAPGLPEVMETHARRMKSLRWILPEADWNEDINIFVEDFYTEYGLAIELQLVEDMAALKRLRIFCRERVSILDFAGTAYMAVSAVPDGSVWLDMLSVEEKRRRILAKGKKIKYFSMKEIWKSAQKRCNCPVLP